ncbi:hypothetical protein DSO57_1001043 [Entomophthora muscae]|uniref:Uncharacterized protein n=1 Tax=Entomophthora muscae TaxID=34485 RepID=A0ACC2UUS2_9FUNG|nr:hypothetical protein DSO57_1001043 [Entomophthora muscae]
MLNFMLAKNKQTCQENPVLSLHWLQGRFHCPNLRNIPDNKPLQDKSLCSVGLTDQNKKLQQFPLIKETAAKQPHVELEIKNSKNLKFGFYTPTAGLAADRQAPAGCTPSLAACLRAAAASQPLPARQPAPPPAIPPACQPTGRGRHTSHGGPVHPCQMGKFPNWET